MRLFESALLGPAAVDAFRKLSPRVQLRNPVMFVVYVGSILTTALLVQARKRISSATETWAALAGGDTNRLKAASDQFGAVAESMMKLHPESAELARALGKQLGVPVQFVIFHEAGEVSKAGTEEYDYGREGGTGSASVDSFTWDLSTDEDKKAPATKK